MPEPTRWTIHLAAQQRGRAVVVVVLMVAALAFITAFGRVPPAVSILAALLLIGSVAEFLFPVTYTLDADGAHARHLGSHRLIPWARVRRVYLLPGGIKLSPLPLRTWAESYRGVLLRTPQRAAVLAQVEAWLAAAGARPEMIEEQALFGLFKDLLQNISLDDEETAIEQIAQRIVEQGMGAAAVVALESAKPIGFLGGQAAIMATPLLGGFLPPARIERYAALFSDRQFIDRLVSRVEALEAERAGDHPEPNE